MLLPDSYWSWGREEHVGGWTQQGQNYVIIYSFVSACTSIYDFAVVYNVCILVSVQVQTVGLADINCPINLHNIRLQLKTINISLAELTYVQFSCYKTTTFESNVYTCRSMLLRTLAFSPNTCQRELYFAWCVFEFRQIDFIFYSKCI